VERLKGNVMSEVRNNGSALFYGLVALNAFLSLYS